MALTAIPKKDLSPVPEADPRMSDAGISPDAENLIGNAPVDPAGEQEFITALPGGYLHRNMDGGPWLYVRKKSRARDYLYTECR